MLVHEYLSLLVEPRFQLFPPLFLVFLLDFEEHEHLNMCLWLDNLSRILQLIHLLFMMPCEMAIVHLHSSIIRLAQIIFFKDLILPVLLYPLNTY